MKKPTKKCKRKTCYVYLCPTSMEYECKEHGGFDTCCNDTYCPGNLEIPTKVTMHVNVPPEATDEEVDELLDIIAQAAYEMPRGKWDPFVSMHGGECHRSDGCCGPGSRMRP